MTSRVVADRPFFRSLVVLAIACWAVSIVSCSAGDETGGEQIVEMTTGSFRAVADYRAEIWIGKFDSQWREDLERMMDTIEIEIRCGAESQLVAVSGDRLTEPVCGVQVQLVEITSWNPPRAKIRVVWEGH
jgi:hypothetical protein